ncbi:MAG TPA: DUF1002 domain-containing protein [Thermomicrobiales bacterium]|nr:DUF1002 domain-containing protein [Thermomicrobiales bacterium]
MQATRNPRRTIGGATRLGQLTALLLLVASLAFGAILHTGSAKTATTLVSFGESNTDAQRQELMNYFGNPKDAEISVITVADTKAAMKEIVPDLNISLANSSAALTCLPLGEGLVVTTFNISSVTPAMYAMALVTAGVGDANLIVASPADAQAGGLTALAGIFQSWDKVSCESSQTTPERQELALRQLALTTDISTSIGQSTGYAGAFVIDSQRAIVMDNLNTADKISAAIANQEAVYNIAVPAPQREQLVDFYVDLQKQKIDWSTFSKGWTIEYPEATKIQMRGDGGAIINAQASATARAAKEQTRVAKRQTEAAEAKMTQEAADLTATAMAQPTATATATPLPSDGAGVLQGPVSDDSLSLKGADGKVQTFTLAENAALTRGGKTVTADAFKKGDSAAIKIDFGSGQVVALDATPAPSEGTPIAKLIFLLPILLLVPLGLVLKGRSGGDPFVVKRVVRD